MRSFKKPEGGTIFLDLDKIEAITERGDTTVVVISGITYLIDGPMDPILAIIFMEK